VASPGCYAAGTILATAPLVKNGLARLDGIVVDGKSGVTGAGAQGRKVDPMYLYTEANENVQAYALASHRHTAEMDQELSALAGGGIAGIKPSGKKDLALIHSPTPARSAAVFTSNQVKGAPVLVSMEHARGGAAQAIVASSGCANVCTGERGVKDAREMTKAVADLLRIPQNHVLIAATGVIGVPLPMDKIRTAIPKLVKSLSPQGGRAAAEAIMTTDP